MMREIVEKGLASWGLEAPEGALDRLVRFGDQLMEKNKVMDLTALREPEQVAVRHLLDSLALVRFLELEGKKVLDIGSGAGFPAMPVKLWCPKWDITALDSTAKRMDFVREAAAEQGIEMKAVAARAEEWCAKNRGRFDLVTSRAVAPLNILCELSLPYVKMGGLFAPMKSTTDAFGEELAAAKSAIAQLGGKLEKQEEYTLPVGSVHQVLIIRKVKDTPPQFPRRYSRIKAKPL